ncbi:restriction endonuclease subunit S [Marinactinospora rubrisoli]|uniref:Restriction endonuclease subunit S n=1 Tax=Marinactinospora rubrisoli TaxID=2715399 RepID=A0ABW2K8D6_9ACTN
MSSGLDMALPESWSWSPLKFATTFLNRGTAPDYVDDGPVRVISQAANQATGIDWERARFHNYEGDPRKLKGYLVPDDVLINSTGTGTLGRVGYFAGDPSGLPCLADGHVTVARADRDVVDPRYLYYWLSSTAFQGYVYSALIVGATNQIELNRERLAGAPISLPPLDEQRRIVDFLDSETVRIDQLIAGQRRMVDVIEERRIAVTSHLVFGRDRDGDRRDSKIPSIGLIPSTWRVLRNKIIMREVMDLSDTGEEELLSVSHLTGVTPRSEKDVTMFLAESMVGYKRCQPGDLVINTLWAWMGALGVSQYPGILSPAYGIYRMTSDVMDGKYLDFLVRTPEYVTEMTRFSKGVWTSRLRLYPEAFLALSVPMPPRDEQAQIVNRIVSETYDQERLKSKLESFAKTLTERRQALITAAVTGQFDVTTASGRSPSGGAVV